MGSQKIALRQRLMLIGNLHFYTYINKVNHIVEMLFVRKFSMKKHLGIALIAVLLITVGLSGCIDSLQEIILDDGFYHHAPRDPFVFDTVILVRDVLVVKVSYSGGCAEHEFMLLSTGFMESHPVQVHAVVSHDSNDDPCEAWVTQTFAFSLVPLKHEWQQQYNQKSGTIHINLEGWERQIPYRFLS